MKRRDTSEQNLYACVAGFHAVDLDSASVNDLYIPSQVRYNDRVSSCLFYTLYLSISQTKKELEPSV